MARKLTQTQKKELSIMKHAVRTCGNDVNRIYSFIGDNYHIYFNERTIISLSSQI